MKPKTFQYPEPNKILINDASFELFLRDFGDKVKSEFSILDLMFILPAWAIVLTSEFNNFWIFDGSTLEGLYIAFLIAASGTWLRRVFPIENVPFLKQLFKSPARVREAIGTLVKECERK